MQERLVATEKRLAELRAKRQRALSGTDANRAPEATPMAAALADLETAVAQARSARQLADAAKLQPQLDGLGRTGLASLGGQASVAGTFSAAIAGMLGRSSDSAAERTADGIDALNEKTTDMLDEMKRRPPLAFEP